MDINELTQAVIGLAMKVHRTLGPGYLESVYRNALAHELSQSGRRTDCEARIEVWY